MSRLKKGLTKALVVGGVAAGVAFLITPLGVVSSLAVGAGSALGYGARSTEDSLEKWRKKLKR